MIRIQNPAHEDPAFPTISIHDRLVTRRTALLHNSEPLRCIFTTLEMHAVPEPETYHVIQRADLPADLVPEHRLPDQQHRHSLRTYLRALRTRDRQPHSEPAYLCDADVTALLGHSLSVNQLVALAWETRDRLGLDGHPSFIRVACSGPSADLGFIRILAERRHGTDPDRVWTKPDRDTVIDAFVAACINTGFEFNRMHHTGHCIRP